MKLLTLLTTSALAFGIATADASALRTNIVVESDVVRLGDIFEDAGTYADRVVINAPSPGRRLTLDMNFLADAARVYRVNWRPMSRFDRVVVERAGKTITANEITQRLRSDLVAEGMGKTAHIELTNRSFEINIPLNMSTEMDVRNVSFDAGTGRFNALLLVGGEQNAQRIMLSGRTYATTPLPVLRRAVSPGELIRSGDIEIIHRREDQISRDAIMDPARLVGTTPRSRLRAGEPVRENETRAPVVVARNAQVLIRLVHGPMTLTAQGKAEEEGARGDVIRVRNMHSNKTIEATITGPDAVAVNLGPRLAVN
jgi:flagellar basal body P-ring formation protein FlgA